MSLDGHSNRWCHHEHVTGQEFHLPFMYYFKFPSLLWDMLQANY